MTKVFVEQALASPGSDKYTGKDSTEQDPNLP